MHVSKTKKTREGNKRQRGKKEIKVYLFVEDMILYVKVTKD
jgi:hypothetical protein